MVNLELEKLFLQELYQITMMQFYLLSIQKVIFMNFSILQFMILFHKILENIKNLFSYLMKLILF